MADRREVHSQVGLAALLDVQWLEITVTGDQFVPAPGADGGADLTATHPTVERLIEMAATSTGIHVRATVAARPDLDATVYALVGTDDHPLVRGRVAANPSAPAAVLRRLSQDTDPGVRDAARRELARRRTCRDHERYLGPDRHVPLSASA